MQDVILIRYGELNTKGKNRRYFINKLESNIKKKLKAFPNIEIQASRDRMLLTYHDYDTTKIIDELKNVFGIQSFSLAKKVALDYQVIEDSVLEIIDFSKYQTFKVITKRANKQFEFSSDEINRKIASRILKETNLKVVMKNYDLAININISYKEAYIFFDKIAGAHGYPVGVSGKGLLMLSGGIDSPVAGYLVMKRGVQVEAIHFSSFPYTSQKALNKVLQLASKYLEYTNEVVVHNILFTDLQLEINKHVDPSYSMTILRRMMYRISQRIAEKRHCEIIVNGESIAQVASQTLQSMSVINKVIDIPVIRPLACLDKLEIIDLAKRIDTYELSILPYEDCCTIFLPANPIISPSLERVLANEARFDFEPFIEKCVVTAERYVINQDSLDEILNIEDDVF